MRKLRRLRDRVGYGTGHFTQLASSHDFFGDGWGRLDKLTAAELRDTVEDMQACWRQHESEVRAECVPGEPWFAQYATDLKRLIREVTDHREHSKRYPHGDACKCPHCLEREQITTASPSATANAASN